MQCNNKNGGGKQQDDKKDKETKGIVQLHLADFDSDVKEFGDDEKSSVSVDTEGNESPSLVAGDNSELEEPDDAASTHYHVGVLYGYDNDDVSIPTLAEVFDSIDQDHLFAWSCLLSVEDDSDNESKSKSNAFDVNNLQSIFISALYKVTVAKTSSEAAAKSWFEAVDVKFEICNLQNATLYHEIFTSSGA